MWSLEFGGTPQQIINLLVDVLFNRLSLQASSTVLQLTKTYNKPLKKQNRTLWECAFFNVFKLANVANAELHIPVSAVPPSLAMHISLFCLLQGYQKYQKTKKWRIHVRYQNIAKTSKNQKKNKMAEPMSQWIPEYCKNPEKPKKTKWQNLCPSVWHGVSTFVFFVFFGFSQVKPKKTKWQNLCPSVWHGVSTFVFLVFPGKTKKTKKNKMAEPMSQCLAWGQYFCFFCFFWFSQVKPKKQKKQNGRTYVPVSGMGSVLLFFFGFPR